MTLPNAAQAHVAREKITEYLLSPVSDRGQHKQASFVRFGFRTDRWEEFGDALRSHCQRQDVVEIVQTQYGTQYTVVGPLDTPDARNHNVRGVWQIDHGTEYPRFITAYPDL